MHDPVAVNESNPNIKLPCAIESIESKGMLCIRENMDVTCQVHTDGRWHGADSDRHPGCGHVFAKEVMLDVVRLHVPRNICFPTSEQIDAKRFIALSKAALKRNTIRAAFFAQQESPDTSHHATQRFAVQTPECPCYL